jgi:hypothetical protein
VRKRSRDYQLRLLANLNSLAEEMEKIDMNDKQNAIRTQIQALTTEQLRREFTEGLRLSSDHLTRLALVLEELERRGDSVTGASAGLLNLLRRIARGELLAETVVRFAGSPQVMASVGKLPVVDQQAILADEKRQAELLRPRPAKSHSKGERRQDIESKNPLMAAELATSKDLAEMIAEMISRHPDPSQVWSALCSQPTVQKLLASPKPRRVG